jgi:hypothetical protein
MKFSNKRAEERFTQMTKTAQDLAKEMVEWSMEKHNVELVITETWTLAAEDHKLNRTSDTHRTGRAFDIRTRNLKDDFKSAFIEHFNFLYQQKLGAITPAGPVLIVDKPHGSGPHWHVQVKRGSK